MLMASRPGLSLPQSSPPPKPWALSRTRSLVNLGAGRSFKIPIQGHSSEFLCADMDGRVPGEPMGIAD